MPRVLVSSIFTLTLLFSGTGDAAAAGSKIAKAMGNLRWGMNEGEVIRHVQRQLEEQYKPLIRKESDLRREEDLRDELREKSLAVRKSLVEFDGSKSSWDASNIAGEYTHGNRESMLVAKDRSSATYYFFIDGRLWKWIKTFDSDVFGGNNFKRFRKTVGKKFGRGHVKTGERNDERGKQQWIEYRDRNNRLQAVDDTKFYGKYALVFEDLSTVRDLAALRTNTIERKKKKHSAVAGLSRDFDESQTNSVVDDLTGKDRRNAGKLKHKKRRSLFADEKKQETQEQYEARRKRAEAAQRAKAKRAHLREQRKKAAKALDGVPSAEEDDDPLSGL